MIENFTFNKFDEVSSTQDEAKKLIAENNISHGCIVTANTQINGRGRYDRNWISPKGGLYITICLKPSKDITDRWSQISYIAGVSICEAIRKIDSTYNPRLKWVNDVLIGGSKVAGILLELVDDTLLVGIGANLIFNQEVMQIGGTSFDQHSKKVTLDKLLKYLLERFKYNYNLWIDKGFEPIRTFWMRQAYGIGKEIQIKSRNQTQQGTFIGIDESGQLQLLVNGNLQYISAGEIFFN